MRPILILAAATMLAAPAFAQVNGSQQPTDANGPTPPSSTRVDPQAPPPTAGAAGSRPPAAQNPTDGNGPAPAADVQAPPAVQGAPVRSTANSPAGADDVSAPSTHTATPDQVQSGTTHKRRRPHG